MTQGKKYGPKGYIPKFERGMQNTTKSVEVPTPKPTIPDTPVSKPLTNPIKTAINKIPSKLKKIVTTSVDKTKTMKKASTPDKFKKKIAMRKIKNVAKDVFNKKDGGKTIPEGPKGAGLRALKAEAPEITSKMGFKKKGGIVAGINNIKGMKQGGQCRGMGAASRGGGFNVS